MTLLALLQDAAPAEPQGLVLSWIDWIGLGLSGLFLLLGVLRGLWWQVIRLVGLGASVGLARAFSQSWGASLHEMTDISLEVSEGIVWVGLFILGIVATAFIGTLGKKSLQAIQLGMMDRAGGALAGLATGLCLHVALLVALGILGPQPWTQNTLEGTYSSQLLAFVTTRHSVLTSEDSGSTEALQQWLGADQPFFEPAPDSGESKVR
jgi:uncharacterized membrane protein required for colicin V production